MRFWKTALVCICLVGLTQPARSQKTEEAQKAEGPADQGIPGYLNPRTGEFKPMVKAPREESEAEIEAPATAGDFKVTFNITVKSSIPSGPSGPSLSCTFTATVFESASLRVFSDSMTVAATGSGSSRTCSLDMFYSWPLSSASSDTVALHYDIQAVGTSASLFFPRLSSQDLPSIKPASGTTTKTITATI